MIKLNLVYPDKSDIEYKVSRFPDGQQNITINGDWTGAYHRTVYAEDYKDKCKTRIDFKDTYASVVQIQSRLNNWTDLELIVCAVASLRELGVEEIHLYTPYICGARSDRKFEEGGNNYLKDVICPVINSLNFKTVTCLDPHSDVLEACIKGFKKISNFKLIELALNNGILGQGKVKKEGGVEWINESILISPDAGASKKIYKLAEQIGYKGDIITCSKDRDTEGRLSRTVVPVEERHLNKDIVLIDDIFDYGTTFKNIGAALNDAGHQGKKYLIVTHSIQTEGLKDALKWFDCIYTTTSVKDHGLVNIQQLNVF